MPRDPAFHVPSLALALLAAGATCAVSLLAVGLAHGGTTGGLLFGAYVFALYFFAGLVIAGVLGLPLLLVLRALGVVNVWSTLLVGAVLGAAIGWNTPGDKHTLNIVGWLIAGTLAALAGRSTWIWAQRRYATKKLRAMQLSREGSGNFMEK